MLKKFSVSNYKCFFDEITLTLTKGRYDFSNQMVDGKDITKALFYGRTGCGKTIFFEALSDISNRLYSGTMPVDFMMCDRIRLGYIPVFNYVFIIDGKEVRIKYTLREDNSLGDVSIYIDNGEAVFTIPEGGGLCDIDTRYMPLLKIKDMLFDFIRGISMVKLSEVSLEDPLVGLPSPDAVEGCNEFLEEVLPYNRFAVKHLERSGFHLGYSFELYGDEVSSDIVGRSVKAAIAIYNIITHYGDSGLICIDDFNFFDYDTSVRLLMKLYEIKPQVFISTNNTYLMKNDFSRPDCVFHMQNDDVLSIDNCTGKFIKLGTNTEKIYRGGGFNFEQY